MGTILKPLIKGEGTGRKSNDPGANYVQEALGFSKQGQNRRMSKVETEVVKQRSHRRGSRTSSCKYQELRLQNPRKGSVR